MARVATSLNDLEHLYKIKNMFFEALNVTKEKKGIVLFINLVNNVILEGYFKQANSGNGYLEIVIQSLNGEKYLIDLLDVKFIRNSTTPEKMKKYFKSSIITKL